MLCFDVETHLRIDAQLYEVCEEEEARGGKRLAFRGVKGDPLVDGGHEAER